MRGAWRALRPHRGTLLLSAPVGPNPNPDPNPIPDPNPNPGPNPNSNPNPNPIPNQVGPDLVVWNLHRRYGPLLGQGYG